VRVDKNNQSLDFGNVNKSFNYGNKRIMTEPKEELPKKVIYGMKLNKKKSASGLKFYK